MSALLVVMTTGTALAQMPIKLQGEADSLSYALGFLSGYRIIDDYPGIEKSIIPETFQYALQATLNGEMPFVDEYKTRSFVQEYYDGIKREMWRANREAGERFLEENQAKRGISVTSSGLQYQIVHPGSDDNQRPRPYDDMVISYVGKTIDGIVFDEDDEDYTYPASLNDGLEEGTQLMSPGAKYIFYMPHKLAYGEEGRGKLSPYSVAVYEVEMKSMTRDHSYYDEEPDTEVDMSSWGSDDDDIEIMAVDSSTGETIRTREMGDYLVTSLSNTNERITIEGYDQSDIEKSYAVEGFKVFLTGDRAIVFDSNGREVFRGTFDEESNSYDRYYLTEFRHKNGEGPIFVVLDMGFDHGSFFGSMVYKIENGKFDQVPEFLNLVTFDRDDDDEHYGRLTPTLYLYRTNGQTTFTFDTQILSYNPAGTEVLVPGEDFVYIYDGEKLVESGAATGLTYFRNRELTKQFQQTHDYRIWHAETGDVDGDGQDELVVFVYENETIYVCELNGNQVGEITGHDLPYDYSINRSSRVLRGNMITVERDDDSVKKHLVVHNGNLVEKQ